jgi:hypothetical protein
MPNHYHIVVQTLEANLSVAVGHLNSVYAQWWNGRHGRCGHVLQGRFKAQLIQKERYLAAVCRYVLKNPVRARLVEHPEEWEWSSYRASAGLTVAPPFLDTSLVVHLLCWGATDASTGGRGNSIGADQDESDVGRTVRVDARFVGDGPFLESQREKVWRARRAGIPRREWRTIRPTLAEVFACADDLGGRNLRILDACRDWGFTHSEIAEHLGLHIDTVGRAIRKLRKQARRTPLDLERRAARSRS